MTEGTANAADGTTQASGREGGGRPRKRRGAMRRRRTPEPRTRRAPIDFKPPRARDVAARLRGVMNQKGLSIADVAHLAGMPYGTVAAYTGAFGFRFETTHCGCATHLALPSIFC